MSSARFKVPRLLASLFWQQPIPFFLGKWLLLSALDGLCVGSASALFLVSLDWATNWRENHLWIIALLPVAGFLIGCLYHYLGFFFQTDTVGELVFGLKRVVSGAS